MHESCEASAVATRSSFSFRSAVARSGSRCFVAPEALNQKQLTSPETGACRLSYPRPDGDPDGRPFGPNVIVRWVLSAAILWSPSRIAVLRGGAVPQRCHGSLDLANARFWNTGRTAALVIQSASAGGFRFSG